VPTVGTTPIMVIATGGRPVSFELHADADNSDTILYSTSEPKVPVDSAGELLAGQSTTFSNFVGALWIVAESGTQNYSIDGVQYADVAPEELQKA
jgi:hypothetical protein